MALFCDGLRHLYTSKLNEVSFDTGIGLNSWLRAGKNYFVNQDQGTNDFSINVYEYSDFLKPYAFDINRLSCASLESINDIESHSKSTKFIGWVITKLYYSAFFSAHCILKINSNNLANIDGESIQKVTRISDAYGYHAGKQKTGQYILNADSTKNSINFKNIPKYDDSHEGVWRCFLDFLNGVQPTIYHHLPLSDAQEIIDKIDDLKKALCHWGSNGGNWLSRIRNQVNYSQSYGTWFPYKDLIRDWSKIYDMQAICRDSPLKIDINSLRGRELLYYTSTCQLINAINFELLIDLHNRHPENKSFIKHGIIQYHNTYISKAKNKKKLINM